MHVPVRCLLTEFVVHLIQASKYCAERLHHALAEEIARCSVTEERSDIEGWRSIMLSYFSNVDKEVGGVCSYGACDDVDNSASCCSSIIIPENVGTTDVVVVVSCRRLFLQFVVTLELSYQKVAKQFICHKTLRCVFLGHCSWKQLTSGLFTTLASMFDVFSGSLKEHARPIALRQ
ncbi:hypothetical protein L7F22_013785 [Adiantum nelumboides]|nr:hypothetical protein [Adiantum nelumboides]